MSKLEMFRGDTRRITLSIVDGAGAALDLTDYKVWFTAKRSPDDADNAAVIAKTTDVDGGITKSATTGDAVVLIAAADTASLTARRTVLIYDVQTRHASTGEIATVETGTLIVKLDVTRASA